MALSCVYSCIRVHPYSKKTSWSNIVTAGKFGTLSVNEWIATDTRTGIGKLYTSSVLPLYQKQQLYTAAVTVYQIDFVFDLCVVRHTNARGK